MKFSGQFLHLTSLCVHCAGVARVDW